MKAIYTCAPPFIGKTDKFLAPFMAKIDKFLATLMG